jgi:hypothetical protein
LITPVDPSELPPPPPPTETVNDPKEEFEPLVP